MSYPPDFEGLPCAVGNFFDPKAISGVRQLQNLNLEYKVEAPSDKYFEENCRNVVGGHICPPPAWNRVKPKFVVHEIGSLRRCKSNTKSSHFKILLRDKY